MSTPALQRYPSTLWWNYCTSKNQLHPQCHFNPQENSGLIKWLLSTPVSLNKVLLPGRFLLGTKNPNRESFPWYLLSSLPGFLGIITHKYPHRYRAPYVGISHRISHVGDGTKQLLRSASCWRLRLGITAPWRYPFFLGKLCKVNGCFWFPKNRWDRWYI